MGRTFALLVVSVLLLPASSLAQGTASLTPETREAQSVALQADWFDEQNLTPLPDAFNDIARMLREIRSQFPLVAELRVPASLTRRTSLIVGLQSYHRPQVDRLCDAWESYARARSETLEIPPLDELTRRFAGSYEVTCRGRGVSLGSYVVVNFPGLLHVPSLTRIYSAAAGVTSANDNHVNTGGVTPVAVAQEGDSWRVTFGRGEGDCPAGCTYREYHRFLVGSGFTIQFLGTEQQGERPSFVPLEDPAEDPPDNPAGLPGPPLPQ
jgi:hypothetical protein